MIHYEVILYKLELRKARRSWLQKKEWSCPPITPELWKACLFRFNKVLTKRYRERP